MATIQNSPPPVPNYNQPKKSGNSPLLYAVIAALVLMTGFFAVGYFNRGTENDQISQELLETEQFKAQAEQQYYDALSELELMRSDNEEMNALIDQQTEELRQSKERIDGLLRDSRNLASARRELATLREQADQYLAELNQLREENAMLTENVQELSTANEVLTGDLQTTRQANDELTSERAVLVSEREQLTTQNEELNQQVTAGSAIMASTVTAVGQKQRNSGRWVDRNRADNVERLYVCMNTLSNRVADPGEETMLMRVINPNGETISIAAEGSGTFRSEETGETIPYTKPVDFQFDGGAANVCTDWNVAGQNFSEGTYTIELYNKGYLSGTTTLELK